MSSDWFGCVFVIFSPSRKCSQKRSPVSALFRQCISFLKAHFLGPVVLSAL